MTNVVTKYVTEFEVSSDGSVLFCKLCAIQVSADRRYIVTQQLKTDHHSFAVNRHQNATTSKVQLTLYSKNLRFLKIIVTNFYL